MLVLHIKIRRRYGKLFLLPNKIENSAVDFYA